MVNPKQPKVLFDNEYERKTEMPDEEIKKTYWFHCDHGFLIYRRRHPDPSIELKCPMNGCGKVMMPGKGRTEKGIIYKGSD